MTKITHKIFTAIAVATSERHSRWRDPWPLVVRTAHVQGMRAGKVPGAGEHRETPGASQAQRDTALCTPAPTPAS